MANLPQPQSYESILSDQLSAYAAKIGIDDFLVGSAVTSFFEVNALAVARASGDIFQIIKDFSVDRATGDALKRLATEEGVTPVSATPTTGTVTITDSSFTKISTKVYSGTNPPNVGSDKIPASDASSFPSTGTIYVGRGTPNIEAITYISITAVGGHYVFNLASTTTKFHNVAETIILAQKGVRNVPVNSIVVAPATGASSDTQFSVTVAATILDGETQVDNVEVTALIPGSSSNVPAGAIKSFSAPPFTGATVTNQNSFTSGKDNETDDQLRVRIKRAQASKGLGTSTAIQSALIGASPSDEQSTIVSTNFLSFNGGATVYIDDGTGYEAKSAGVGIESIVDSALGGEQFFQLATGGRQAPIAKAFLQSTSPGPFDLVGGDTLAIVVGDVTYQHTFANTDFRSPGGAVAFEVTASINSNTTLGFEATTAGSGSYVVIRSKTEGNDSIKSTIPTTSGRDASVQLNLPSNTIQTLRLYKNNIPLSKDGNSATVFTESQGLWSSSITDGDTLILSVDGTAAITYTVNSSDFLATGLYTSVASINSLQSWAQVFNSKLTGVTASVVGEQIQIVSNLGASNRASLSVDPSSTLVTKGMFSLLTGLSSTGKTSDFILDRNTAQFQLTTPLVTGDKLSAGSTETEARVESTQIPSGSITFSSDAHLWLLIDAPGQLINTGVTGSTVLNVSKPSANVIRYTSGTSNAFDSVLLGDYVIVWSNELNSGNRTEGRVNAKTSTTLDVLVTASEYSSAVVESGLTFFDGFVILRSSSVPQKFRITAGIKTLEQVAQELQSQNAGLICSVLQEEYLVIRTTTKDTSGSLLVVTADAQGKFLGITAGASSSSEDSLVAFYDSQEYDSEFPLFVHSTIATGTAASPIDSYISTFTSSLSLSGRDPNEFIKFLHPYGASNDAQAAREYVQESSISGTIVNIINQPNVRRLRANDRFFIANPLDFGSKDTVVAIVDNDPASKSFEIPLYRRAITNPDVSSNSLTFNAYDVDSGASANFFSAFKAFDFSNFKVLMQAKKTLKHTPSQTALLYRANRWGRSGEKINIGYIYPSAANASISSVITIDSTVDIRINVKSGAPIGTSIDNSTEWNVTVSPNTPLAGIDQVTFTYSGTGTAPALSLSGGEYVNISTQTELSQGNTGVFRVSTQGGYTPTTNSFSVTMPTGVAVSESGKSTLVNNGIVFYAASNTTASDINTYVNANLSDYATSTIVNDGGMSGSGVISLSTYEDSVFSYSGVSLLDGINWIASSDLAGSPQFTFKKALSLPTDIGYAFNNAEEVRIIPTTSDQVNRLTNILAVTGFTTAGTIGVVDRQSKIEFATDILGSSGSMQIVGGLANSYSLPVLDSSDRLDNSNMSVSVDKVNGAGIHSDQWFRLQASVVQEKEALLSSNTSINAIPNSPTTGQTTIQLLNRNLNQRYFGKPRNHVRSRGNTFRIEKQGSLVCLSWNGVGTSPAFLKSSLNFNDSSGGTLNVSKISGSSNAQYTILTGNTNFTELSIGDLITISAMANSANNGTFLVTGVSDDGTEITVLNSTAANEFSNGTFTFIGNANAGDQFIVGGSTLVAGTNFAIGGSSSATAINLATVIGTLPSVTAAAVGTVVTVTATIPSASIAISYVPASTTQVTTSGANLAGISFSAGAFTASSSVSEGDTMTLSAPFNVLNQGKFRVIRRFNDSVWFENPNVVEEEAVLAVNLISLGFDSTTSFKINASNNSAYLNWNGTGTEPHLENAQMGDVIRFGIDFPSADRGDFMVSRSGIKLQQISSLLMPSGGSFASTGAGKYFTISNAGNVTNYYVWFNVFGGSNTDPAVAGKTGIEVTVNSSDTDVVVATKTAAAIGAISASFTASSSGNIVTVTTAEYIETTPTANFNMPNPFGVTILQSGRRTFLECTNPSASSQSIVLVVSGVLECHRPQLQFSEYEATVAGDSLVVTGDALTTVNAGNYTVVKVLNRDSVVVSGAMVSVFNASLNGKETFVQVKEASPYFGYKHVLLASAQPGAESSRSTIVFDTNAQYEKIDEAASVIVTSINKLDFNTTIKQGLDSYRYNTGDIAEANRIIYGDPRDPSTYPGVGAAGAEIFVKEPLTRRITMTIDVRLNTGVPFAQTADQVRNSVSYVINSNDVGQPIAISSIVSAVNAIPGVRAVSIGSPLYDVNNDLIFLAPGEKARIIDPADIAVAQVGS